MTSPRSEVVAARAASTPGGGAEVPPEADRPDAATDRPVAEPVGPLRLEAVGAMRPVTAASTPEAEPREASSTPTRELTRPVPLRVRIGQSFATIQLDGVTRFQDVYRGTLLLGPGRHRVEVLKPGLGRFRPREVEVTEQGRLYELLPGGGRRPVMGGVLDFRVPLSADEAARTPGWSPG